jgi:hypothetical protein
LAIFRRLRRGGRPAWAGVGMPRGSASSSTILAALVAVTTLAAIQLASTPAYLTGLPGFVASSLGDPRDDAPAVGEWRSFEYGISRPTEWGHETIAYGGARPEKYLTVSKRQGIRVWRWRLAAHEAGVPPSARPVQLLDASGRAIGDDSLSWSVERRGDAWLVRLRVVDTNLPLPYVLAPVPVAQRGIE